MAENWWPERLHKYEKLSDPTYLLTSLHIRKSLWEKLPNWAEWWYLWKVTCLQIGFTFLLAINLNLQTSGFIAIYPITLISGWSPSVYFQKNSFVHVARVYEAARLAFYLFQQYSFSHRRMECFRCMYHMWRIPFRFVSHELISKGVFCFEDSSVF
jgi:hypothetical protein